MKNGTMGLYNYLSMTKIDLNECRAEEIKSTCVHEYIHSYLTKSTLYGKFLMSLNYTNFFQEPNIVPKSIFKLLIGNMLKMQETVATLIEIIYDWHKKGLLYAKGNLKELPKPYSTYIKDYIYLFDLNYTKELYHSYLDFLEQYSFQNPDNEGIRKRYDYLRENNVEENHLNLLNYMILHSARLSLSIELVKIDSLHWRSKHLFEKSINRTPLLYIPSSRFGKIMKWVLPNKSKDKEATFRFEAPQDILVPMEEITYRGENINDFIMEQFAYTENNNPQQNSFIENMLNEYYSIEVPDISIIDVLEKEALLSVMPTILNKESSQKLWGKSENLYEIKTVQMELFQKALSKMVLLHIHVGTGTNNKYRYSIRASSKHNDYFTNNTSIDEVEAEVVTENISDLRYLLKIFSGIIYFTGCQRSEHILDEINDYNKDSKIYITSASSLKASILFINKYFADKKAFITSSVYSDVLYVKNDRMIFFQPVVLDVSDILNIEMFNGRLLLKEVEYLHQFNDDIISAAEYNLMNELLLSNYRAIASMI